MVYFFKPGKTVAICEHLHFYNNKRTQKNVILKITSGSKFTELGQKGDLHPRKITLEPAFR